MKAVDSGVALLDERLPGWRSAVDPEALDLSNSCGCVLGQVFGDFHKGEEVLGLSRADSRRLGFFKTSRMTYDRLTAAWRKVLAA